TAGGGVTAAIVLPPSMFAERQPAPALAGRRRQALDGAGDQGRSERPVVMGTSSVLRQAQPRRLATRPGAGSQGGGPAWWEAPARQGAQTPAVEAVGGDQAPENDLRDADSSW